MKKILAEFIKRFGRRPKDQLELLQFRFKLAQESGKGQVIEFPPSAITDWTKPRPTTGKKGEVIGIKKSTMSNADYSRLKDEWFGKIIANTDDDINTFLKRGIDAADERFKNLTSKQRKDFLDMVDYRLKHGNKKFMNDFTDAKGEFKLPEDFAGGGIAGMLGEPTYADDNHRVPYGGGGAGKPPITFTLQGGGSYGSNEIGPGLDLTQSGYGFNLGTNIDLPFGFSLTGDVGIGRGTANVDYKGQNVFTGVDETKLGEDWNVGLKWSKKFNEGGRVPYDSGNMVLPKEKPFQGLFHTEVGGPVITKDDSEFEAVVDRWSQFARQKGEGPEGVERNKSFALENIVRIGRELGYEDDEIKEIILRINKAAGGRVPFSKGKLAGLEAALKQIMEKFGKKSITTASKLERPLKAIEAEKTKAMFDNLTNKINTQEALSKGSKKMAGPIENVNRKSSFDPVSTDHTTWLQQEKFFDPKALDMYGKKVPANWIEVEKKAAQKLIDDLGPLNVSPNHPNYRDMKAIRQRAKDRLESIKITEALGGNIQMHDWLRMNRKNINIDDYVKKPGAKKVVDELSGIKLAHIQRKLSPADELKAEFPGISDDLIKNILADKNPQRIAEVKAAMKEALKMQEKGMGVEEIVNIFKKQGKKPTKHASGGLAGMLGE